MTQVSTTQILSASLEDYLEAIFHIVARKQAARAKDISKRLGVNSSSVTGALRSLAEKNLINYAPYDVITLTPEGKTAAREVIRRHKVLLDFFVRVLGIEPEEAEECACKMEHSVPATLLERLVRFVEFLEQCPRGTSKWIEGFGYYCENGRFRDDCERCVALQREEVKEGGPEHGDRTTGIGLNRLKPGERGKITKVTARGEITKRILDMGLTSGAIVEVERVAPLGDPLKVKVKGYHLSLRKEEAAGILVEKL